MFFLAEDCKETWQGLRTRLRIEMAKVTEGGHTAWRWYDDMQFFVPHLGSFPSSRPKYVLLIAYLVLLSVEYTQDLEVE